MHRRLVLLLLIWLIAAVSASAAESQVVRIGYQKSGALLLVKAEGGLEKRLAALGWSVTWSEFSNGAPLIEAIDGGSIDLGHAGDGAAVFAQANGKRIRYLACTEASPASIALITRKSSPIDEVSALKGKTIGVAKGTSGHYFALCALAAAGLKPADVTWAWLSPADARAAFESGAIDAWAVWDPFLAAAQVQADARVLHDGLGLTSFREFTIGAPAFAAAHPDVVLAVLAELTEVGVRARKDPAATAALLAPYLGVELPVLALAEGRKLRYGALPIGDDVIAEQQKIADLFAANGLIAASPHIAEYVWAKP